ncbi:MAG TPA: hypothetical protein VD790_04430 [Thermoleophilaceae bacterium]|nr:hypothetical protein [Thermoleophilaceae bacterium]
MPWIPFDRRVVATLPAVIAFAGCACAAEAAWKQPVGGASPINQSSTQSASAPSLAEFGGVPYVAWTEFDGVNEEVRVSRLNAAGNGWQQPVGGASPINQSSTGNANATSLAVVAGALYVAWLEDDGVNYELRVSRLNEAGNDWQQPVGGASPINQSPSMTANSPRLAEVGGVLYVAWYESDGTNDEMRVSRLNQAGTDWVQVVGGASPINNSASMAPPNVLTPSLADVGGVPHVAWIESDGANQEVRVSRLNAAGNDWVQVVGGASPINNSATADAVQTSLVGIGGIPYVAWAEFDAPAGNPEARVSRLNSAGTAWEEVVGGPSPINVLPTMGASQPRLAAIGGVPYISWTEFGATNREVRVSRLNSAGTAWEQVIGGPSPINHAPTQSAEQARLAVIGGVPHVAWVESDATNDEVRVSRLEPDFSSSQALPTDTGATLLTRVATYGLAWPVGFEHGAGFASSTATTKTAGDSATVVHLLSGLTPATAYSARPFATAGSVQPRVRGPAFSFTTRPANGPGPTGPRGPAGEPAIKLLLGLAADRLKTRAGRRVKAKYVITAAAALTLEIYTRTGKTPLVRVGGTARKLGRGQIAWNGKIARKRAPAGRYRLLLRATAADRQTTTDQIPLRITRPPKKR